METRSGLSSTRTFWRVPCRVELAPPVSCWSHSPFRRTCSSRPILEELARVLAYPRVRSMHGLDDAECTAHVRDVEAASLVVAIALPNITAVERDPDDNAIIAAAIAGSADVICTRDRHFRNAEVVELCSQHQIRIMDDLELLRELRGSPNP